MSAVKLPLPDSVVIPMAMHIGAPAKPVVKVGDYVKTGQLIGEPGGFVSAPIYASVSGTVKKIGEMLGSNGRMMQTVEIESDGLDARWEGIAPPKLETMQDFLDAVRASGLVGLGGAGFPTVVKLTVKNLDQIKCVIINGAECEPYITSDTRAMIDYSFDVIGMRMKDVFEATGGFKEEPKMVLYGGPMMGIAVPDLEQPILKNTNAILAFGEAEATPPEPTACIKCGKCIAHCPLSLMPCEMETAYKKGNIERLMHLKVNLCMECGCCSFICPAHRPLVQTNKLAKAQAMAYKNALKAKAEAEKQKEAAK